MGIVLCFLPIMLSVVIFTAFFKLKFTHQLIAILLGLVAVFPISVIQYFLPSLPILHEYPVLHALLKSLVIYGLIEEFFKMILLTPLPHKELSELDFLFLSFTMGLALGCFESVVYFFDHMQIAAARGANLLYGQIFLRIITSDIIHMTCTGLCGLFLFSCRTKPVKFSVFLTAIALHGTYDFFVGFQNNLRYFAIVVILLSIIECRIKYINLQNLCEDRLTIFY